MALTRGKKPESPSKLGSFRKSVESLSWEGGKKLSSLNQLFMEVDTLVQAEIDYYYRVRKSRAWWSGLVRFVGWGLATIGILMPLVAATHIRSSAELLPWGYVFLAAAGAIFAGNSLLGGSTSHVRFVSTQLALERTMTESRIRWCAYKQSLSEQTITEQELRKGFELVLTYAETLYSAVLSETTAWGESLISELEKYTSAVAKQSGNAPEHRLKKTRERSRIRKRRQQSAARRTD